MKKRKSKFKVFLSANLRVDFRERTIILDGEIDQHTANVFRKLLFKMQNDNADLITVRIIRSTGGCAISSFMINGMLRSSFAPIRCIVERYARSGAVDILQGASERIMLADATLKLHWVAIEIHKDESIDVWGASSLLTYINSVNKKAYQIISDRSGMSKKEVKLLHKACMKFALTAKAALEYGLIDEIECRKNKK